MASYAIPIVLYMAGLVFAAGGAWFMLRESQKHVNGLGAKLAKLEDQRNERHNRVCMALIAIAGEGEQKSAVLQCLAGEQK